MTQSKTIFQLPHQGSWFENIAVRNSGTLLATRLDKPELWEIDPRTGTGCVLLTLPSESGKTSLTGIAELTPDVFALGAAAYDLATGGAAEGSCSLWTVDLASSSLPPTAQLVVELPDVGLLNGITAWDATTILGADSSKGRIYKVEVAAKTSAVAIEDDALAIAPGSPIPFGANGIKVFTAAQSGQKYLYVTNSSRMTFSRVPVDDKIVPSGPFEVVGEGFLQDDFVLAEDGTAYVTTNPQNTVVKVPAGGGAVATVAGEATSLDVAGGTACAFGRTDEDRNVLYVVTCGGLTMPVGGSLTEPAKVVAIRLE